MPTFTAKSSSPPKAAHTATEPKASTETKVPIYSKSAIACQPFRLLRRFAMAAKACPPSETVSLLQRSTISSYTSAPSARRSLSHHHRRPPHPHRNPTPTSRIDSDSGSSAICLSQICSLSSAQAPRQETTVYGTKAFPLPSVSVSILSTPSATNTSRSPFGQRTSMRVSFVSAPSPKCNRRSLLLE